LSRPLRCQAAFFLGGKAILFRYSSSALWAAWLLLCLGGLGCGGSQPTPVSIAGSYQNLTTIKLAYLQATKALDRPPRNLDDLRPFLKKLGDPAEILRSPNDGEAYKILWGVDVMNVKPTDGQLPVTAYEQLGKDGKRYVLFVKEIRQVSDEDFKKARFPPGYQAPL